MSWKTVYAENLGNVSLLEEGLGINVTSIKREMQNLFGKDANLVTMSNKLLFGPGIMGAAALNTVLQKDSQSIAIATLQQHYGKFTSHTLPGEGSDCVPMGLLYYSGDGSPQAVNIGAQLEGSLLERCAPVFIPLSFLTVRKAQSGGYENNLLLLVQKQSYEARLNTANGLDKSFHTSSLLGLSCILAGETGLQRFQDIEVDVKVNFGIAGVYMMDHRLMINKHLNATNCGMLVTPTNFYG